MNERMKNIDEVKLLHRLNMREPFRKDEKLASTILKTTDPLQY